MLVLAVVVAGDRAGGDVRAVADVGIAKVAEVVHLHAFAKHGVLHLHVVSEITVVSDTGVSADVSRRAEIDARANLRFLHVR